MKAAASVKFIVRPGTIDFLNEFRSLERTFGAPPPIGEVHNFAKSPT